MKKRLLILLLCFITVLSLMSVAFADTEPTAADFEGKRIGIQSSTTFVTLADEIFADYEPYYYETLTDCVAAICGGKVDAALGDEPVLRYCAAQVEGVEVISYGEATDEMASIAPKTEEGQRLVDEFNEFYRALVASGERDALVSKWMDGPPEGYTIDNYESFPAPNGVLVIATDPTYPPLQFMVDGEIMGYETELWVLFCKECGYRPQFENCSFGGIIAGVTSGKYDIGASAFSVTEERKQSVLFTDTILVSGTAIAYPIETEDSGFWAELKDGFVSTFVNDSRWKSFLEGFAVTAEITVLSIIFGTVLGFGIYLLCREGKRAATVIFEALRRFVMGMPVVVWLMVLYYIFFGKSSLSGMWVAVIGFSILFGFSVFTMLSAGERSVDAGQALAAEAMGYSKRKTFFRIILPQATQFILPSFQDEAVSHMKATAIVGYIAVVDVTKVGDMVRGLTYDAFFPLIAVAAAYFLLAAVLRLIISAIRRSVNPRNRSKDAILKGAILK